MKRILLLIIITSLFLTSCSKSEDLSIGGTLKITASNGSSKTCTLATNTVKIPSFRFEYEEPNSTNGNLYVLSFYGMTDVGAVDLFFNNLNPIQIGKEYSYTDNKSAIGVGLYDWIDADFQNTVRATITFSKFQYAGRITGIAINYDKDGKILIKAEFDFVSTKPII